MPDVFDASKRSKGKRGFDEPLRSMKSKENIHDTKKHHNRDRKRRIEESIESSSPLSLPKLTKNPLASFSYYPERVRFANEDPEEEIVLLVRKHPLTNTKWIIIALIMIVAPAFLTVMPVFEILPLKFQIISVVIWYMLTAAFVFEEFLSWFFNVNIVTDERIVEVDFHNLIYRELTDANIDQIEDVTVKIGGAVRTYFNFGDLEIQTAAEIPHIVFESIPNPDLVAKILRDLRVEEEQEKIEGRVR